MPRKAIVALEIKRKPKVFKNLLTWRQMAYLFPTIAFCMFVLLTIRFDLFYAQFMPAFWAILLRIITGLIISGILLGIAAVIAFVPAFQISFLKYRPKPNTDPNDIDMMIDGYILMRLKQRNKVKVLAWRGGEYN